MAISVSTATVIGNVGRDPEIKETATGTKIAKFSVATSKKMKDGTYKTSWHDVTAFNRAADLVSQYVTKGRVVYVSGDLEVETWEDRDTGKQRSKHVILANVVKMVDKREEAATETPATETIPDDSPF